MQANEIHQFLPTQSVKSLRRISDFINKLIEIKNPIEREFVCNIDADDFISYTPSFVADTTCDQLIQELKSHININGSCNKTQSVWFNNNEIPYTWNSVKSGKVTRNRAVKIEPESAIAG